MSFKIMLVIASLSLIAKIALISNTVLPKPSVVGSNLLVDWGLLWSALVFLAYMIFVRDAFSLLSPEAVVEETLKSFDLEWMEVVRQEFADRARPLSMHLDRDPMILLERILISALERGDIHSFQAGLIIMRDNVQHVAGKDDGGVLDMYLSERLASVTQVAAEHHADAALEFYCQIMSELTSPSPESIRSANLTEFDIPLGNRVIRQIADRAIKMDPFVKTQNGQK